MGVSFLVRHSDGGCADAKCQACQASQAGKGKKNREIRITFKVPATAPGYQGKSDLDGRSIWVRRVRVPLVLFPFQEVPQVFLLLLGR